MGLASSVLHRLALLHPVAENLGSYCSDYLPYAPQTRLCGAQGRGNLRGESYLI